MPGYLSSQRQHVDRIIISAGVFVAVAAWFLLLRGHGALEGHGIISPTATAPTVVTVLGVTALWLVMMVAMMLPSVLPWILAFARVARRGPRDTFLFSTTAFVTGYFTIWAGFSLLAATAQVTLQHGALLASDGLALSPMLGGVLLLAAGAYELSPMKEACLSHCRSPITFLLTHWRDGAPGAFNMGARHGLFCTGCCWALMTLSFALGVMNIAWMAVLTLMIALEKIAPRGDVIGRGAGLLLGAWGIWLILG